MKGSEKGRHEDANKTGIWVDWLIVYSISILVYSQVSLYYEIWVKNAHILSKVPLGNVQHNRSLEFYYIYSILSLFINVYLLIVLIKGYQYVDIERRQNVFVYIMYYQIQGVH